MSLVIRKSAIHSYGCYTTRRIRKGTLIVEYVGEPLTYEEAEELYDDFENTYLFGLDGGKRIIDGYGVAAFVNHSCKPNCETDQIAGKMWIIALRDIEPGEELTYDYCLYDGDDDAPCSCGAKRCRGSLYSASHLRKLRKKREKAVAAPRLQGPKPKLRDWPENENPPQSHGDREEKEQLGFSPCLSVSVVDVLAS